MSAAIDFMIKVQGYYTGLFNSCYYHALKTYDDMKDKDLNFFEKNNN